MPKFEKGSAEAKEYMAKIREQRTTSSNFNYETNKGKKLNKNITMNLDKETEVLPNGERITKTTTKRKVNGNEPIVQTIVQQEPIQQPVKKGGRPKKYNTPEEAKQAKKQQTLASNKKKYAEKKAKKEGGKLNLGKTFKNIGRTIKKGWESTIEKPIITTANKIGSTIENVAEDVKDYGKAVLFGRDDYPPKVRDILKKVGASFVNSITIKRTPVSGLLTGALSLFSLGKFGKRLERSFDELFHLFIEMTLDDGKRVLLEKNEVINMDINPKSRPKTETKLVNTTIPHLTIDEMLDNTQKYMGKHNFFGYSARDNNCQDFIVSFFKSNNIGDQSDITFIKQDTKKLFKDLPYLRKLSNTITDLGASANVITTGVGVQEINNYADILNHLTEHITDPKEPIDPRDYKQATEMINAIKKEKQSLKGKGVKDTDYKVQSVVFDKDKFNITQAKKWLKDNGYKSPKVDKQENTLRFRQIEPSKVEKEGYKDYRTKELGNSGIKLIIAYKNIISSNNIDMSGGKLEVHHYHHMIHHSPSSSDDDMEGGKINIGKAFKKMGSDIKKGFNKTIAKPFERDVIKPSEKALVPLANKTANYITAKKGGLATDLIDYGIPATTGAVLGALGSATGNPALGVLGSAAGSKLGKELIAPEIHKVSGAGNKRFVKGSKEAKEHMARIRAMKKN